MHAELNSFLKWHYSFGEELQTKNFYIYDINEMIIQTQKL